MDEPEILQMHAAGMNAVAIAEELGIAVTTVRKVLKKKKQPTPAAVPVDEEAVTAEYTKGVAAGEILRKHSISYATLYRILAAHNIPTRAVATTAGRHLQLEAAVKLYTEGAPLWAILQETGVAQPVLHNELHRLGAPFRRPRKT